jgi:hypothetical protein
LDLHVNHPEGAGCAQVDWRGDGGPEYDAGALEAPVLSEGARAAQARAGAAPPSHTLHECLEARRP